MARMGASGPCPKSGGDAPFHEKGNGASEGTRTRDLQRDRPALATCFQLHFKLQSGD